MWEQKKSQLEPIIVQLKSLQSQAKLDRNLPSNASKLVSEEPPQVWQWSRSPRINDQAWPVYQDIKVLNLHAVILRWRKKQVEWIEPPVATSSLPSQTQSQLFFPRPTQSLRGFSHARMANYVEATTVARAEKMEHIRREHFQRAMGELEAKKLAKKWRAQGSLLKLEPCQMMVEASSAGRPDLSWLNKFRV